MHPNKSDKQAPRRPIWRSIGVWLRSGSAKCLLVVLVGTAALTGLFCVACAPQRYSVTVGTISHQTITATKDVEDTLTTAARRNAAAEKVEPTYHFQVGASEEVLRDLDETFKALRLVQQYGLTIREPDDQVSRYRNFSTEEITYAQEMSETLSLSRFQATVLLRTPTASFDEMVSTVRLAVESALNTNIREGQEDESIAAIKQIAGYRVDTQLMQNIVGPVLKRCIRPNMVIEQEATRAAREAAAQQVEPVMYLQGQNIIREGEVIQANQVAMLEALGLLQTASYDFSIYGGAILTVLMAMAVLVMMLHILIPHVLKDLRFLSVIMIVLVLCEALCVVAIKFLNVYLAPVLMVTMLLTGLLGARVGLSASLTMTIIAAGLAAGSSSTYSTAVIHLLLTGMISGTVAVQFIKEKPHRVRTVIAGVAAAAVNLAVFLSVGLMTSSDLHSVLSDAAWSMASGILSGLVALGFQPVFEAAFNLATPSKLLELANPNQPLLRRLLLEAPGTYHHAIVVANLSEAAAERIGANPLLARTGAYFHDIGKLKRPLYFKENQMGENPHDRTDPYVSAAIVTAHTSDGIQLAQKYHLPPEIQQIIIEHHGDTPVMYFYHKALQMADGKPVDIADFRYEGHRPTTKESAIVMLADTIEAAVRSIPDPTPKAIEQFIERLVRGKLGDGQLSDCPLTLRDIDEICAAFNKVLGGVFHERIEYPTVQVPPRTMGASEPVRESAKDAPKAEAKADPAQAETPAEAAKCEPAKPETSAEKIAEAENGEGEEHPVSPEEEKTDEPAPEHQPPAAPETEKEAEQ